MKNINSFYSLSPEEKYKRLGKVIHEKGGTRYYPIELISQYTSRFPLVGLIGFKDISDGSFIVYSKSEQVSDCCHLIFTQNESYLRGLVLRYLSKVGRMTSFCTYKEYLVRIKEEVGGGKLS